MDREEIKNLILRRTYAGAFEDGVDYRFSLEEFAAKNGIERDLIWKIFYELEEYSLIKCELSGGIVEPTTAGLLYAEQHDLADRALVDRQSKIRTKLLVTLADLQERSQYGGETDWEVWIREADVGKQDFQNNFRLLQDLGLIDNPSVRGYKITPAGMDKVRDYRKRKRRLEDFERLEKLDGVTAQQRGHVLENLLADTAEWEGWEVNRRVRAQGQENDIIMHVGLHYFLSSCKWKAEPLQAKEAENLESRVRRRATANGGILFSMSGFTPKCIEEIRLMIAAALIIPFGSADIRRIMQNEATLTDLLDDKIDQVMNHRKILIDGVAK